MVFLAEKIGDGITKQSLGYMKDCVRLIVHQLDVSCLKETDIVVVNVEYPNGWVSL